MVRSVNASRLQLSERISAATREIIRDSSDIDIELSAG